MVLKESNFDLQLQLKGLFQKHLKTCKMRDGEHTSLKTRNVNFDRQLDRQILEKRNML